MATAAGLSPAEGFSGATRVSPFGAASCASILSSRAVTAERSAATACGGGRIPVSPPAPGGRESPPRGVDVGVEILHLARQGLNGLASPRRPWASPRRSPTAARRGVCRPQRAPPRNSPPRGRRRACQCRRSLRLRVEPVTRSPQGGSHWSGRDRSSAQKDSSQRRRRQPRRRDRRALPTERRQRPRALSGRMGPPPLRETEAQRGPLPELKARARRLPEPGSGLAVVPRRFAVDHAGIAALVPIDRRAAGRFGRNVLTFFVNHSLARPRGIVAPYIREAPSEGNTAAASLNAANSAASSGRSATTTRGRRSRATVRRRRPTGRYGAR